MAAEQAGTAVKEGTAEESEGRGAREAAVGAGGWEVMVAQGVVA